MVPRGFTRDHFSLSEPVPGREKVFYSAVISVILFRGGLGVKIDRLTGSLLTLVGMETKGIYKRQTIKMLLVSVICILINMGGVRLMEVLEWPFYMDSVGTVIAAALSGYLPGIVVGLFTNLIKGISDTEALYYVVVNAVIALIVYWFAKKGFLKKIQGILGLVVALVVFVTLYWMVICLVMKDPLTSEGIRDTVLIELADKGITVLILVIVMFVLPKQALRFLEFRGWQQRPLTEAENLAVRRGKNRKMSLRTKLLMLLILVFVAMGVAAVLISAFLYRDYTQKENTEFAKGTSQMVGNMIDPERIDEYLEKGEAAPGYLDTKKQLENVKASNPGIEFVYVYAARPDGFHVVFDIDTEEYPGDPPGYVTEIGEDYDYCRSELLAGEEIEPVETIDRWGHLITVLTPVKNSKGETVCYAGADISMKVIYRSQTDFLTKLILLFVGFFILSLAVAMWISDYNIILPINSMAISASKFAYEDEESFEDNVERIRELDIRTGDEIENMYQALSKTTEDSEHYVSALRTKTETIAQMQNALIMVLADMVESRDENTGDHVRKTAAYTRIIMDRLKALGYYTDQLTDQFIYDVEHSAPLHDIGKIAVSDVILNKPGKLTDEEFSIMKTHTTAGAQMIDQVINTVPDSGYLKEAKNLAEYHHEKWNGRGYPYGLAGEAIPLSARIMAVADVFDALVSKRCYKDAFPFEKAMDIIRQDAGSHFDPKVVEAFLASEVEIRQVAEHFTVNKATREVGMTDQLKADIDAETTGKLRRSDL